MTAEELLSKIPRHNMNIQKIVMARDANVDDAPFKPRTMIEITDVYEKEKVLWVMEEYAKSLAINLNKWCYLNDIEYNISDENWWSEKLSKNLSDEQLFDLYLSQTTQP